MVTRANNNNSTAQPQRVSLRPVENVTLLEGSTLVVGANGAEARKVIDPKHSYVVVGDTDRYAGDVKAIPLRNGASDVQVVSKDRLEASHGLAARLNHYVENGGEVTIGKHKGVITEFDGTNATLEKAGTDHEVVVYPGADHGFFCDQRATYQKEAAADAWQRVKALFKDRLV